MSARRRARKFSGGGGKPAFPFDPHPMPTITRPSGLRITLPDDVTFVVEQPSAGVRGGGRRGPAPSVIPLPPGSELSADSEREIIAESLKQQDMALVEQFALEPAPVVSDAARRSARAEANVREVPVEIEVGPDEDAVILLEQDGFYTWQFHPERQPAPPAAETVRRRGLIQPGQRLVFRVPLGPAASAAPARRGFVSDLLVGRVRAFVFKFAGR